MQYEARTSSENNNRTVLSRSYQILKRILLFLFVGTKVCENLSQCVTRFSYDQYIS